MPRILTQYLLASALLIGAAAPVEAQYRRHVEDLEPIFAATLSAGALFAYDETITPVETPFPDDHRRGVREAGHSPWVAVAARYGRGIAVYGNVGVAFPGDAELTGTHPLNGAALDGSTDVGPIFLVSAGASVVPLRDVMGLRLDIGPAWVDLGNGGSYLALRVAASAKFLEIGERGAVLIGWDGYFAGGQHDRDEIEYQIRGGLISGVRVGYELSY